MLSLKPGQRILAEAGHNRDKLLAIAESPNRTQADKALARRYHNQFTGNTKEPSGAMNRARALGQIKYLAGAMRGQLGALEQTFRRMNHEKTDLTMAERGYLQIQMSLTGQSVAKLLEDVQKLSEQKVKQHAEKKLLNKGKKNGT
ncbi:hypothetical protein Tiera_043 [Polaromonas phage Tiera]|nr:hypothetical protein Tiera_043 [Polaromonas phage Tiera]